MRFGRLMCFWQSLRPHFLCRYCDRKFARSPPKPIASVVRWHSKKRKKDEFVAEKSLTNCPLLLDFLTCRLYWICWFSGVCSADNSSQILKERKLDLLLFRLRHITNEILEMEISDLNIRKPSSLLLTLLFSGLRVVNEQAWRKEKTNSLTTRKKRKPVSGCRKNA